ncbi:Nitrogen fixation protein FixH [Fulvimarina manganoxydans]|uniref:Nitrogen fixation protein FixH n=1 Tax=Fulvimarina manganoxydans TaxID=937218 RepID=A0A1W2AYX3_9HYPH|nr:FixH family protein [Fulvimarina manganoxydans]SMC65909.1 Nitrogen fixation protein FixH [Fulvimarina manganoxydans]
MKSALNMTTLLDTLLARKSFTGMHMLAVMLVFFGTIISVNLYMARQAMESWTGLVVENSYVASQHFNDDVAERERLAGLGYSLHATYANETLTIHLARSGKPLAIGSIEGRVGRPVTAMEDRDLTFSLTGDGTARSALKLGAGLWKADVLVRTANGEMMERGLRFIVTEAEAEAVQ